VAGLAGVTEDYLSQIERGLKTPTIPLVRRFSKILGVRVSELLGESATEHDERVHPVGFAVQRALMSYGESDGSPDLVGLRGRVDGAWSIWQGSPRRYTESPRSCPRTSEARVVECPRSDHLPSKLGCNGRERREPRVSVEASEMVTVPRAELDALKAELRRLRREVGRTVARARIEADSGPGDAALTLSRSQLAEAWGIRE
jgi:ribosome-binding protein aMBF1 (putative translation factor)